MILLHYITVYLDIILIHYTYTSFLYIICTYIRHFSYTLLCMHFYIKITPYMEEKVVVE